MAGMLTPAHRLDLVRHFMLFKQIDGQTIITVYRYQQYRAVNCTVNHPGLVGAFEWLHLADSVEKVAHGFYGRK